MSKNIKMIGFIGGQCGHSVWNPESPLNPDNPYWDDDDDY